MTEDEFRAEILPRFDRLEARIDHPDDKFTIAARMLGVVEERLREVTGGRADDGHVSHDGDERLY